MGEAPPEGGGIENRSSPAIPSSVIESAELKPESIWAMTDFIWLLAGRITSKILFHLEILPFTWKPAAGQIWDAAFYILEHVYIKKEKDYEQLDSCCRDFSC